MSVGVLTVHHDGDGRRSVRSVVNNAPGFDAVGDAATAEEALELALELHPQLVMVHAAMPGIDGFETSRRILAVLPQTTVVLLYGSVEPSANALAGCGAAAAMPLDAVTPRALQTLWETRRTG